MRITRIHADAFGAMAGRTLELGPGLNVIVGPNESGKSTWHAALYAALCGLPPKLDWNTSDERFAAFRRPRELPGWAVSAELELDEPTATRRVAIMQNLLDPLASIATDVETGDDVSQEIWGDDGTDTTRWLGFDRRSYAATSWIEQAGARSALVSVDGRNALQLAVAACVGEDDVDAALAQIEAARRDHIGGTTGVGARAKAIAEVRRWQADRVAAEELAHTRRDAMTRLASATGAVEIARKKLRAAKAFDARAEANRLRALVARQPDEPHRPAPGIVVDRESMTDTEVHPTVALAELEVRTVERETAELANRAPETEVPAAAAAEESTVDLSDHGYGFDDDYADHSGVGEGRVRTDPHEEPQEVRRHRSGPRVPTWDRVPVLRHIWGVHRISGLEWVEDLSRTTLLRVGGVAALAAVAGVALAIGLQSIWALLVGLVAAVVVLGVVAELTPSPAERSGQPDAAPEPAPIPVEWATRLASPPPAPATPAAPARSAAGDDLTLRRNVALTKLAAALIARGRRAHPLTAVADYERYVLDCAEAAELRAEADFAAEQQQARELEAQRAREEVAVRAERVAAELEERADPYDLSLPYRQSVADAERDLESAERDLDAATAAMAGADATVRAHPSLADVEERMARAEALVARVDRLDRVLQRTHTELTLARETVLRDIASGMTPRLTDYLAQFTDRPFSTSDTHDLQDRIGESLLRREPMLGSFSTSESTFLFTRIALGQHLAGDAPQGPLLVDDITSSADTERIRRMLSIMRRIASQRQVVIFAHQTQVRNWALKRIGKDPGLRLIRLTTIAEDPRLVPPPPRIPREARPMRARRSAPDPRPAPQAQPSEVDTIGP